MAEITIKKMDGTEDVYEYSNYRLKPDSIYIKPIGEEHVSELYSDIKSMSIDHIISDNATFNTKIKCERPDGTIDKYDCYHFYIDENDLLIIYAKEFTIVPLCSVVDVVYNKGKS